MTQNMLKEIFSLSAELVRKAKDKNIVLATAESCTGGLIGAAITATSGSSAMFKGGIIAYENAVKTKLLGVPPSTLGKYGAVSEPVARRMAAGAVERLDVDLAVSVTGIAGPGGGTPEKPVGTVWIGIAIQEANFATLFNFTDLSRNKVRDAACLEALRSLITALDNSF